MPDFTNGHLPSAYVPIEREAIWDRADPSVLKAFEPFRTAKFNWDSPSRPYRIFLPVLWRDPYPRQNGLALALRDLGRLERTLFTLDWLRDPALRRRANAGLNKGEARNALARAIFFNQLGEMRDRSFENQAYRASGLNLLVSAIILWNTRYLEVALDDQRRQGIDVPPELMRHVAPLGWEHISLTGDYVWGADPVPADGLRPLRRAVSLLAA